MTSPSNQVVVRPPFGFSNLQAILCGVTPYCSDKELLSLARTCTTIYQGVTEKFLDQEWRIRGLKKAILLDDPHPHKHYIQWHSPQAQGERKAIGEIRAFLQSSEVQNPERPIIHADGDISHYAPATLQSYTRYLLIEGVWCLGTTIMLGVAFNMDLRLHSEDALDKYLAMALKPIVKGLCVVLAPVSMLQGAGLLRKWTILKSPETYQKVGSFFHSSIKKLSSYGRESLQLFFVG